MFLTCRAVVPRMREQGGGKIVNISSGTPFRGVPFLLHYVTSKGAIVALTRALAKELGKDDDPRQLRRARLHDVATGVKAQPEVIEALQGASPSRPARCSATRCRRTSSARSSSSARPRPDFITGQTMVIDGGQYFH